ncbi:hypothetical protein HJC23_010047 [Cyclotella cryptica]|uniref:Calmodulin-lysine N-methyltransferase n=1 Tax=Cyclotella cryptica TaxID=29204 RepID=A0ABD3NXC6_9STRA
MVGEASMDEFWSIAFLPNNNNGKKALERQQQHDHEFNDSPSAVTRRYVTILPPHCTTLEPLTLHIQLNANEGVFSDISAIPSDASYLLAAYLYGTQEGHRVCFDACHPLSGKDGKDPSVVRGGGILELGSGLGIVGTAAVAASIALGDASDNDGVKVRHCPGKHQGNQSNNDNIIEREIACQCINRVVMTDLNDNEILSHLRRNVDANLAVLHSAHHNSNNSQTSHETVTSCCISVEPCDWMEVSSHLQTELLHKRQPVKNDPVYASINFPTGPFTLILGSALIYLPQHAAACADTLYYYLSYGTTNDNEGTATHESFVVGAKLQRQAILVQLPDRCGFATHFLPRCHELGLEVTCKEFEEDLIERVEAGLGDRIPSVREYPMYFIRLKSESVS